MPLLSRAAFAAALLGFAPSAFAEPLALDLPGALARAHQLSPGAARAGGALAEAEGAIVAADVLFTSNPEVEAGVGPRFVAPRRYDVEARVTQALDPGRRGPRRALARAELDRTRALGDVGLRELDREVATAFYEAIYTDRALELATSAEDLARRAADFADRKRRAGDATDLDANLARAASGRARAATLAATSARSAALGELAARIGAGPADTFVLRGDLHVAAPDPEALVTAAGTRADLRELAAARRVASAEHAVATANARPDLGVWLGYMREDGDSIVLGGVRLTLPAWGHGEGEHAIATAHLRAAEATAAVTRRAVLGELGATHAAYAAARDAVALLERDVLPALDDSEKLLGKSVDAGQLAISEYLVARQQILDGRREYLDRLLALARAATAVRYQAGVAQ